jgi:hypothetical protein
LGLLLRRVARGDLGRRPDVVIGSQRARNHRICRSSLIHCGEISAIGARLLRVLHLGGHWRRVLFVNCG